MIRFIYNLIYCLYNFKKFVSISDRKDVKLLKNDKVRVIYHTFVMKNYQMVVSYLDDEFNNNQPNISKPENIKWRFCNMAIVVKDKSYFYSYKHNYDITVCKTTNNTKVIKNYYINKLFLNLYKMAIEKISSKTYLHFEQVNI